MMKPTTNKTRYDMEETSYQGVKIAQGRAQDRERERINETIYRYFLHLDTAESINAGTLADAVTDEVITTMQATGQDVGPALLRVLIDRLGVEP